MIRPPIVLFTYKRLDSTRKTIASLSKNRFVSEYDLYVFSDAHKNENDFEKVNSVRYFLKSVRGFKSVKIFEASQNLGLAQSVISGVSKILNEHESVIVLEDDLVTSENFLEYMSQALAFYATNHKIFSISGFSMPINRPTQSDVYFTLRASSWGWATWKDRWFDVDWSVCDYESFSKNRMQRKRFNLMGSDMSSMLDKQMNGRINSWAIRWCYHQFKSNLYSVYPFKSKVINIGLQSLDATHTYQRFNRFETILDSTNDFNFNFSNDVQLSTEIIKQFVEPYSIKQRIKYKIINTLIP